MSWITQSKCEGDGMRVNRFSSRIPVDKQYENLYVPLIPNMVLFYYEYSKVWLN